MSKSVTISLYVDPYATFDSSPEEEYEEVETAIRETLPEVTIRFVRDVLPHKLKDHPCSVYVFDIGGLCREDWNGERRLRFSKDINGLADDWDNSDKAASDIKFTERPNVALPHERDEERLFQYGSNEHYTAAIRRWVELG